MFAQSAGAQPWIAQWICASEKTDQKNSFFAFRKQVAVPQVPASAIARIAADSKYWLWINDTMVVREGGLKRGPAPNNTYYDEVDIAPYLHTGNNTVSILLWYFGIEGFSHRSSGKAGMIFDCQASTFELLSDASWQCSPLDAYQTAGSPAPNPRLSEASILFDATRSIGNWQSDLSIPLGQAVEAGYVGIYPWHELEKREIPFWKDAGLKNYASQSSKEQDGKLTVTGALPYDAQLTAYFKIDAPESGLKMTVYTDNYLPYNGGEPGIRFEYITKKGIQEFEMPGWVNGHKVFYEMPSSIRLIDAKYRETGYDTEFSGNFNCSDPFFNALWKKASRTLYVNMRDTYMDCPDRERAQWPADAVLESEEAYYAMSTATHALTRKWLRTTLNWQKFDGSLYGPVPGGWILDLPDQTLTLTGLYGLWEYFLQTGDRQMLQDFYPAIQRYLLLWQYDDAGLVKSRYGSEFWGDRTDNKDLLVIANAWFYMTLQCLQRSALVLNNQADYDMYSAQLKTFREAFNQKFWTGSAYRDPAYKGATDDRSQALAVLAGLAGPEKYPLLLAVLQKEEHASTYMEKYVSEALFVMGYGEYALQRHKKRFANMVNDTRFSTLWEDWSLDPGPFGISSVNHGWSGGGLVLLSRFLCGIAPVEPAYRSFQIIPQPANIPNASASVATLAGLVQSSYSVEPDKFILNATVPSGADKCILGMTNTYERVTLNGKKIWESGTYFSIPGVTAVRDGDSIHLKFGVPAGEWQLIAYSFPPSNRTPLDLNVLTSRDTVLCLGDTALLTVKNDKAVRWFKDGHLLENSTKPFLNVWDSGYYYAVTGDSRHPDTSLGYRVTMSTVSLPSMPVVSEMADRMLVANADTGLQWRWNGHDIAGAVHKTYKPSQNGAYSVKVTLHGCSRLAVPVLVYSAEPIFEPGPNQFITIFPNPAIDHIRVIYQLAGTQVLNLTVTGMDGTRQLFFSNVHSGDRIPLETLAHGAYIVTLMIQGDSKPYSFRLVK
ncbi:MAG: T9SS type A sorting domain-containing protein [Chitinophagaceae bacterium]|nr:T9SS type A sorting domain-containing protein [Chitinophagaceae bacterium]